MRRWLGPVLAGLLILGGAAIPTSRAAWTWSTGSPGSSFAMFAPSLRVTTYQLYPGGGGFGGPTYNLSLNQALSPNYFVIMRGAAGNNDGGTNRDPDENYARVTGDPFGNLGFSTPADVLRLGRGSPGGTWQGQVTVVEALRDTTGSSFRLLDVLETSMGPGVVTATAGAGTAWGSIGRVGLYGGGYGGGVSTTSNVRADHITGWARVYPSGANTVNLERQAGGGGSLSGTTTFTTYVVEWGSQWTIQRATVTGSAGGDGADQVSEYDTAPIAPVARSDTFVVASGRSSDNGLGDGWEGAIWTLGDGVNLNATESLVAVGAEWAQARSAEVYVHTHPDLAVDYRFGPDGTIGTGQLTGAQTVAATVEPETYDNAGALRSTGQTRAAIISNATNGTGTLYPRPIIWARHTDPTTVTWTRSRSGQPGVYWLQSVDFASIGP